MRRRLFRARVRNGDSRIALFAVVSLMLLLLPFLLLTTSPVRLTSIAFQLSGDAGVSTARAIEDLAVSVNGKDIAVLAQVRKTDVRAQEGQAEARRWEVPAVDGGLDYRRLQEVLLQLHRIDPAATRIRLMPADDVPTEVVVALIDVARAANGSPLFPDVILDSGTPE